MGLGLSCTRYGDLYSASAGDEVHDDGDDREQNEQVNQEATDVKDQKTGDPKNQEDNCEYEKHANLLSDVQDCAYPRNCLVAKRDKGGTPLLSRVKIARRDEAAC